MSAVYHTGFLAIDRFEESELGRDLDKLANRLFKAANKGEVVLSQRRVGAGEYEYLSTPRRAA